MIHIQTEMFRRRPSASPLSINRSINEWMKTATYQSLLWKPFHREQEIREVADLADTGGRQQEKELSERPEAETVNETDYSSDSGRRKCQQKCSWSSKLSLTDWTWIHFPDIYNVCMWLQCSRGPNRMLMLSWCRRVEGGRIPDEL